LNPRNGIWENSGAALLIHAKADDMKSDPAGNAGERIAQDEAFAERLASYMPEFEVYLQFDSFERTPLMELRGADLRGIRQRALERLNRYQCSGAAAAVYDCAFFAGADNQHYNSPKRARLGREADLRNARPDDAHPGG